jgi:hypothetical protein
MEGLAFLLEEGKSGKTKRECMGTNVTGWGEVAWELEKFHLCYFWSPQFSQQGPERAEGGSSIRIQGEGGVVIWEREYE